MASTESRRIRFLFRTAGEVHRQFCWLKQSGDDLYWGSAQGNLIKGAVATIHEQGMTLTVPDEIEREEGERAKASFHASGQFHLKRGREYLDDPVRWRLKTEIEAPYRVATLLSRHPTLYEVYSAEKSLTREQTSAQVIDVSGREETRHYFEFFVSPEGRFSFPLPLLSMSGGSDVEPITFSLNEQLILVTRHLVLAPESGLSTWHPELEVWIHGDDESNRHKVAQQP